jgi:3-oxoacyl-[acyl-carrier protein] reductase
VVVNNAGIVRDATLEDVTDEDWDATLDVNLRGAMVVARAAVPHMLERGHGRILSASSLVARNGNYGQTAYAASKAGLIGMARSLARELGSRSITANVVAPGFVETEMTAELPAERQAKYLEQIPLGRYASVEEVAAVVRWVASPEAAYITGAVVPVDGGLGMGH